MIDPVAFTIGPLQVYWYGIVYALGFFLTLLVVRKLHKQINLSVDEVDTLFIFGMISAIVMARIFHVVFYEPSYYLANLDQIVRIDQGGLSIHGGFLGAFIAIFLYSKKKKVSCLKIYDSLVLPLVIVMVFGRIANFINQELVGTITTSPFGVVFPMYDDELRWPSQLIESIKTMLVFQILLYMYSFKKLKPGLLFAWSLILYNGLRFLVNFVREAENSLGIISMGQALSLVGFFSGIVLYQIIQKRK